MVVVCKFGGSSLSDADSVERVRKILSDSKQRRFAVVSAMGSVCIGQKKTTDLLYEIQEGNTAAEEEIRERHIKLASDIGYERVGDLLDEVFEDIRRHNDIEFTASRGEYLMAKMLSDILNREFVDGGEVIAFDNDRWNLFESVKKAKARLEGCDAAVIAGFYGVDGQGKVHTLGRGGSDITGAVVANALNADLYENWTDVDGFLAVDPRYTDSKLIDCLSYEELTLLSYYGARVLHYKTVMPLTLKAIPLNIRNTFNAEAKGTIVSYEKRSGFKGVAVSDFKMYEIEGIRGDEIGDIGEFRGKIFGGINRAALITEDEGFIKRIINCGKVSRINIKDVCAAAVAGCDSESGARAILSLRKEKIPVYAAECIGEAFLVVTGRMYKEKAVEIIYKTLSEQK